MRVFMFSGEDSQSRGMGADLFGRVPEFAADESRIDAMLGYSLRALCLDNPANRLNRIRYSQPAVFVVNALHWYHRLRFSGPPDYVLGHGLGEYNALLAADAFDLLTGLKLVLKRSALMGKATDGAMAVVVGLTARRVEELLHECHLESIDIAQYNTPRQTVISGPSADIRKAGKAMRQAEAQLFVPQLARSAYHSRYMADVAVRFEEFIAHVPLGRLRLPVLANATARLYPAAGRDAAKALLVRQIVEPVRWTASIAYLRLLGAKRFEEVGGGTALRRFLLDWESSFSAA